MAYNPYSKEHFEAALLAAAIKYPEFPASEESQRDLVKMFYERVNVRGGKCKVEAVPKENIYNFASRLYQRSLTYAKGLTPLSDAEIKVIKEMKVRPKSLDEQVCLMLENSDDSEIRPIIKDAADILYPANIEFDHSKF